MNCFQIETETYRKKLSKKDREQYLTRPGMRYVDVGDHSVRVRMEGEGEKAIVFASDSPIVIEHHDRLFELLTPHMTVICLDMPGFGFSMPAKDFSFDVDEFADILNEVLGALGKESYVLSFPCFTSYVAMTLAERNPGKIERLILPQAPDWQGELDWFTTTSGLGVLKTKGVGQVFMTGMHLYTPSVWLYPWFQLTVPDKEDRQWIRSTTMTSTKEGMINCWASIYQAWHSCNVPDFSMIKQPALSLWGPKDHTHYKTDKRSMLKCLPHAEYETFESTGHYSYLQEPERFTARVLSFMEQK